MRLHLTFLFDFPVEAVIRMLLIGKVCVSKFWTFLHLCLRITGQMHIFRLYQDHACPLWPHVWVFFCFKRFISKDIKGKTCKISKGQANQIPIGHKILCWYNNWTSAIVVKFLDIAVQTVFGWKITHIVTKRKLPSYCLWSSEKISHIFLSFCRMSNCLLSN